MLRVIAERGQSQTDNAISFLKNQCIIWLRCIYSIDVVSAKS